MKNSVPKSDTEKIEQEEEIKRLTFKKQSVMKKPKILFQGPRAGKGDDKAKCYNTPLYATTSNTFYFHLNPQRHITTKDNLKTADCATILKDSQMIHKTLPSTIHAQPCAVYSLNHLTPHTNTNNGNFKSPIISNKHYEDSTNFSVRSGEFPNIECSNFRTEIMPMEPHLVLNNFNKFEDIVAASKRQFTMFGTDNNLSINPDIQWQASPIFQIS